jgi:hypothetical protein
MSLNDYFFVAFKIDFTDLYFFFVIIAVIVICTALNFNLKRQNFFLLVVSYKLVQCQRLFNQYPEDEGLNVWGFSPSNGI